METYQKSKEELLQLWIDATEAYYGSGDAIMSDIDFDKLTTHLHSMEDPEIENVLNKIYADKTEDTGEMVEASSHTQMLSIRKLHMEDSDALDELKRFIEKERSYIKNFVEPKDDVQKIAFNILKNSVYGSAKESVFYPLQGMLMAPKFDGMSIKIKTDKNYHILQILTRGGMDVTDKLKTHPDIVAAVNNYPYVENIHGELLIEKKTFEKYFSDGEEYKSIRNCVPGILKKKSVLEIEKLLRYVPCTDGVNPLRNSPVWSFIPETLNFDLAVKMFNDYIVEIRKPGFQFQIDGIVVAFIEPGEQRVLSNRNYPENLIALKYKDVSAETTITGVTWQQKKTGKLTPVYDIEPVQINGVTCTHANGYNYEMMVDKGCGIGAKVTIVKSGEIIPVVDSVIERSENYKMPDVDYVIEGKDCISTDKEISKKYKFYLGLSVLQLYGIGQKNAFKIGAMCNYDIVKLFDSSLKPDIRQMLGGGSVWERFSEFYNTKTLTLDRLVEMLQFDGCGKILSMKVAQLICGQLTDKKGIPSELLDSMHRMVDNIKVKIKELQSYGIHVQKPVEINESTITFEMSNPPKSGITKDEFVQRLKKKYPNAIHTTLTKTTKYLFCDAVDGNTGKINKARKYGIKIMTYEDALKNENL